MLISSSLTIGQATFILRILLQGILFGGIFLLGFIILTHAPTAGSTETHDVLNRIVGQITRTTSSAKWIFSRLRGKNGSAQHKTPSKLVAAVLFFSIFVIFSSISDVGFIGVIPCNVPFPDFADYPNSIKSDTDAVNAIKANVVNASDLHNILSLRCDSAIELPVDVFPDETYFGCTNWHNSTFDDPRGFLGLNSTDSDALLPRRIVHENGTSGESYNSYYFRGTEGPRITTTTIANGILAEPHATGVRALFGVPNLTANQRVFIPKTLAVEADVGCIWMGMGGTRDTLRVHTTDWFDTTDGWKDPTAYTGPEYLYNTLAKNVERARALVKPFFNVSNVQDGDALGIDMRENETLSKIDVYSTTGWTTYSSVGESSWGDSLLQSMLDVSWHNCTYDLNEQLGLPKKLPGWKRGIPRGCQFLDVRGSVMEDAIVQTLRKFLCATSTNISMVAATVETDQHGNIGLNMTHLPSTLQSTFSVGFLDPSNHSNALYEPWDALLRFTLSDNSTGQLSHPIFQEVHDVSQNLWQGLGSPGFTISELGSRMLTVDDTFSTYESMLAILNNQSYQNDLHAANITRWAGEMGASYLLSSMAYNPWAARNSPQLTVISTGGRPATCYKLEYGLAFLPLFLAAIVVLLWTIITVFTVPASLSSKIKLMYGGLAAYERVVSDVPLPKGTILVWEKEDERVKLEVVSNFGQIAKVGRSSTLVEFMADKESKDVPSKWVDD